MRRATLRTTHDRAEAEALVRAIRPDNTDEMETCVERAEADENDGADEREDAHDRATVVTTIERETTGGLRTSVDDYVVNVDVATQVVQHANRHADTQP